MKKGKIRESLEEATTTVESLKTYHHLDKYSQTLYVQRPILLSTPPFDLPKFSSQTKAKS